MGELIGKVLVAVLIVLLGPTAAVVASQDSIPGDRTYPIKRGLENVVIGLASVSPRGKAFFSKDFSKRRFKETIALAKQGKAATSSLPELVSQTQIASLDIQKISDTSVKKQYAKDLSKQIDEYQSGLDKLHAVPKPVEKTPDPYVAASRKLEKIKQELVSVAGLPNIPSRKVYEQASGSGFLVEQERFPEATSSGSVFRREDKDSSGSGNRRDTRD